MYALIILWTKSRELRPDQELYIYMCAHLFSMQLSSRRFMSSSHSLNYDRSFTAKRRSLRHSKVSLKVISYTTSYITFSSHPTEVVTVYLPHKILL